MFRKTVLLLVSSALFLCSYAREDNVKHRIDSLFNILHHVDSDTSKLEIYRLLVRTMLHDCEDTPHIQGIINSYLELARHCKNEEHILNAISIYGDMYSFCMHNSNEAIYWYDSCYRSAMHWENYQWAAIGLEAIAQQYQQIQQYGKAIDYFEKIVAMGSFPLLNKMGALGNMGVIYTDMGNYPKAADCYEKAFALLNRRMLVNKKNETDDTITVIMLLNQIADIDEKMGQYDKALSIFRNIQASYGSIDHDAISTIIFMGIGDCFHYKKDLDSAETNYRKALAYGQKRHYNECGILNHIGALYFERGATGTAREYAMKAIQDTMATDHNESLPDAYLLLGKVYAREKNYSKAVDAIKQAIQNYNTVGRMDDESRAWNELSLIYEQMGNTKEAFGAYRHYILLRDSVFSQDKARQITSMQMQGDFDRRQVKDSLVNARKELDAKLKIQQQKMYTVSGYVAFAVVVLLSFFIYRNYSQEKRSNKIINEQKQLSDSLLLNILPEDVANELKGSGDVQPKQFDHVTVMFTDFANFTQTAERMTPKELVTELHTCFKEFDLIIRKYGIEKIKTVGDGYIAVAGLPYPNEHHAADMVKAALEIRDFISAHRRQYLDRSFGIRIGINSGPVVAGIVGVTKFAYDIWGDTVNTAARMEQSGEEGKINISDSTHALVKDEFNFTHRGFIAAKHKGQMDMYFVDSPVSTPAV